MKKILIAEDDFFLANAYRVKLTNAGFETIICSDGQQALNALPGFSPDLIVLDLIMPVKDGFSVLAELKKDDKYKSIPVIIASNLGQQSDINKGLSLGASDFIVKSSSSLNEIVEKINKVLNK